MSRRVVITGIGLVSPLGIGTNETWQALREGRSGIARIQSFDPATFACQIAGEVKGFDPGNYIEKKEIKKMGRFIHFAIAATEFALASSGFKVTKDDEDAIRDLARRLRTGSAVTGFKSRPGTRN